MTAIREAYLRAAEAAAALIGEPAVAQAWERPSALPEFSVGGLAGHLATQITFVPTTLAEPPMDGPPVPLLGHYERVTWIGADLDAEINVAIRKGGETTAAAGPAALQSSLSSAISTLREALPAQPPNRLVHPPAGPWPLRLDDFLITRMMEIAVHSDDLACSVDRPTPDFPPEVLDPVLALLSSLAVRRHGQVAVLRALSRAERAPATITAF
jgi:hypothetical protein